MTIEKLIERMEENGNYVIRNLLDIYVKDYKQEIPSTTEITCTEWIRLQNKKDNCYNFISGMLWGLRYSDVISTAEHNSIEAELIKRRI